MGEEEKPQLHLSQRRFFSSPDAKPEQQQQWQVPVVVRYSDDAGVHTARCVLSNAEMSLPLDVQGKLKWCYANADEIGFYRQNPDEKMLQGLLANLDELSPLEQMGLLGDQWALVRNGTCPITNFLDVLSVMSGTHNRSVLEKVVGYMHSLDTLLNEAADAEAIQKFRAWVSKALKEQMEQLGVEPRAGEKQNDVQRRAALIDAMTTLAEDPQAISSANRWADKEASSPSSVDPNLADVFIDAAAHFGDDARYERNLKIYEARKAAGVSPQETSRYLNSFALFRRPQLVDRTLLLLDEKVLPQEAMAPLLRQMFSMGHTQIAAWEYVKSHWETILGLGDFGVSPIVTSAGQLPASLREDVITFMAPRVKGIADQSYARAIETMDQLEEFKVRTKADLVGWFKRVVGGW